MRRLLCRLRRHERNIMVVTAYYGIPKRDTVRWECERCGC